MEAATVSAARDLAMALDPALLAEAAGYHLDPWQQRVMRSRARRLLLVCSRQAGKSLVSACLAVHTAIYEPGALVLLLSPSLRQSQELFRRCLALYRTLDRPVPAEAENALSLTLENGARIVSLPGTEKTIRGFSSVRLLVIDEAARVATDLYRSVRPMLAVSGGRMVLLSSPFGTRGFYYEAYRDRHIEGWETYEVKATDVPRISAEFLAEERRTLGAFWYSQEYELAWLDSESSAFRQADIDAAFAQEIEQWNL